MVIMDPFIYQFKSSAIHLLIYTNIHWETHSFSALIEPIQQWPIVHDGQSHILLVWAFYHSCLCLQFPRKIQLLCRRGGNQPRTMNAHTSAEIRYTCRSAFLITTFWTIYPIQPCPCNSNSNKITIGHW